MTQLPTPLVDVEWLAGQVGAPDLVVLDASWFLPSANRDPYLEYLQGHIPGALFFDLDAESDRSSELPHMMPSAVRLTARLAARGIGTGDRIVVYDGSSSLFSAPRVWWMLQAVGHPSVAVLDGGLPRWCDLGGRMERTVVSRLPSSFEPRRESSSFRTAREVQRLLDGGVGTVLDARSEGRFAGREPEPRSGIRSGHIPRSKSLPYGALIDPATGTLRAPADLERAFAAVGACAGAPLVCSCGSGVTACILILAATILGFEDIAVYDGSWAEWGGRDDLPIEVGPADRMPNDVP